MTSVFKGSSYTLAPVAETGGRFSDFASYAGRLVFYATPRGGELGLFAGPDPETDCRLAVGSPLFGSTVTGFALNPVSINDAGQLAVRVALLDERQLVLRADPG